MIICNKHRLFLDAILKTLSANPTFNSEDDLFQKVCYNKEVLVFNTVRFEFDKFKSFLPKHKEIYFLRLAIKHLEDKKLVFSNERMDKTFEYIITLEGLILSTESSLCIQKRNTIIKSYLQNFVWIATLLTFAYTMGLLLHKSYYNNTSQSLKLLQKKDSINMLKIKQLEQDVKLLKIKNH